MTNNVSLGSGTSFGKEKLVHLQQEIAQAGGIVMDGRDIVALLALPQAELKSFSFTSV